MGIATDIALILVAALVGGIIAQKLGQPLLIGYIIAGLAVGPYTGGPQVAEIHDIELLSEIGVALLLFALGLEFNLSKLAKVKWIALIGTPIQLAVTAGVGYGIARLTGWSNIAAIWAGCAMALSSTMVILKMLTAQGELGTLSSRIMISMLIVQDLAMVPMLLIMPQLNDANANLLSVGTALLQAAMFLVLMFVVGTRVMPFVLRLISSWGSRELFLVAVMASGLGIGYATSAVGMSFAFGAFIAGMVLSESDYSHQALSDIIPLRDIFGTVFFVSVGMLIDPVFVWENAPTIAFFVAVVLVAKFVIFWLVSYLFNYKGEIPVHIGLGLFQIGEFSFVLARVARGDDAIDTPQYNLLLATALVTMVLTPSVLKLRPVLTRLSARLFPAANSIHEATYVDDTIKNHAVLIGYGRVGQYTAQLLRRLDLPFLVIERDVYRLDELRQQQMPVIYGDAASAEVLHAAHIDRARMVLIAVGSAVDVEAIAARARELAPTVHIVARAAVIGQIESLHELGIHEVVQPEFEAGLEMMRQTLLHFGIPHHRIEVISDEVRDAAYAPIRNHGHNEQ